MQALLMLTARIASSSPSKAWPSTSSFGEPFLSSRATWAALSITLCCSGLRPVLGSASALDIGPAPPYIWFPRARLGLNTSVRSRLRPGRIDDVSAAHRHPHPPPCDL